MIDVDITLGFDLYCMCFVKGRYRANDAYHVFMFICQYKVNECFLLVYISILKKGHWQYHLRLYRRKNTLIKERPSVLGTLNPTKYKVSFR